MISQHLISILATLPFISTFHQPPWLSLNQEALSFLAATIAFISLRKIKISKYILVTYISLITTIILQYIFIPSVSLEKSSIYIIYSSLCLTAYTYTYNLKFSNTDIANLTKILSLYIFFSVLVSCGIAFRQILNIDNSFFETTFSGNRAYANIRQPNLFATFIVIGLCSLYHIKNTYRISSTTTVICSTLLSLALVTTQSTIGILSFIAVHSLIATKAPPHKKIKILAFILMTALLFKLYPYIYSHFHESTALINRSSTNGRVVLYSFFTSLIQNSLFFGYGIGSIKSAQFKHIDLLSSESIEVTSYTHNLFLDFAIWFGLPIAGILLAIIIILSIKKLKHYLTKTTNNKTYNYFLLIYISIGLHSLVEYPHAYSFYLILFFFAAGATTTTTESQFNISKKVKFSFTAIFVTVLYITYNDYQIIKENIKQDTYNIGKIDIQTNPRDIESVILLQDLKTRHILTINTPETIASTYTKKEILSFIESFPDYTLITKASLALTVQGNNIEANDLSRRKNKLYGSTYKK